MRRTSSGGTSVAPDEMPASDGSSRPWAAAVSSSWNTVVGTPATVVTPSRSTSSTASTGSHLYMRTTLPPAAVNGRRNDWSPPTWKNGNVSRVVGGGAAGPSPAARAPRYTTFMRKAPKFRWVATAPLGRPVVPDVYMIVASS